MVYYCGVNDLHFGADAEAQGRRFGKQHIEQKGQWSALVQLSRRFTRNGWTPSFMPCPGAFV